MTRGWKLLIVSTWFELMWALSVFGQERFQWLALALAVITVVTTFNKLNLSLPIWGAIVGLGLVVDSANSLTGVLVFDAALLPIWLLALWLIFAWYAYFLASFLTSYPISIVVMIGGVAGALSYFAGFKLGAVDTHLSISTMMALLFLQWVAIVFVVLRLSTYSERKVSHEN